MGDPTYQPTSTGETSMEDLNLNVPEFNSGNWSKVYNNHRKNLIADCIDEYLSDDTIDAQTCYNDILSSVEEIIKYHKGCYDKAADLYNMLLGNSEYQTPDPGMYVENDGSTGPLATPIPGMEVTESPGLMPETIVDSVGAVKQTNADGSTTYGYAANVTMSEIARFQRGTSL